MKHPECSVATGAVGATRSGAASIEHLSLSPDHSYFGHHGEPAGNHPVIEVAEIEYVAGRGVRGDRFFDYRPEYKGQFPSSRWKCSSRFAPNSE